MKGYERIPKSSGKKITFSMSEIRSAPDAVMLSMAGGRPQAPAGSGDGAIPPAGAGGGTPGGKGPGNTGSSGVSGLHDAAKSGIIEPEEIRWAINNPEALPDAIEAVIPEAKLARYLLKRDHPEGGSKARLLESVSGYTSEDWRALGEEIQDGLKTARYTKTEKSDYGIKYIIPVRVRGKKEKSMVLDTVWQVDNGTTVARFITSTFDTKTIRRVKE